MLSFGNPFCSQFFKRLFLKNNILETFSLLLFIEQIAISYFSENSKTYLLLHFSKNYFLENMLCSMGAKRFIVI